MGRPKKEKPNRVNGIYEVKVTIGHDPMGRPIRKSFYSKISKEAAKAKAEQFKVDQAVYDITGETPQSNDIAFSAWAEKVLESLKGTVKDSTYDFHYCIPVMKHLIPYFKSARMNRIRRIDIQNYFNSIQHDYSLETMKIHKMILHKIFESAVQNDIIHKNPCDSIKLISKKEKTKKSTYTQEQCDLVMRYATSHRYGLDIILMLSYGITRSELLGIQWDDIDMEKMTLHIQHGVTDVKNSVTGKMEVVIGKPKNDFRDRLIPLHQFVVDLLKQRKHESTFVFCNGKGNVQSPRTWSRRHYDVFMRDMHSYYAKQKIDVPILKPHELRHTRATLWVNSGANLFAIANVLGHADLEMLRKRYAHNDVEATRKLLKFDQK